MVGGAEGGTDAATVGVAGAEAEDAGAMDEIAGAGIFLTVGNLTLGLAGTFLANTTGGLATAFAGFSYVAGAVSVLGNCIITPENNPAKKLRSTRRRHPTTSSIAFFLSNEIS